MTNPVCSIPSLKELVIQCCLEENIFSELDCPRKIDLISSRELDFIEIVEKQWQHLKENAPKGPIHIPKIMGKIEREYQGMPVTLFFHYLAKEIPNNFTTIDKNIRQRDEDQEFLARALKILVAPAQFVPVQNMMEKIEENRRQKIEENHQQNANREALHLVWSRISRFFPYPISQSNYQATCDTIQELNLLGLGLKVLPKEILHFRNLKVLHLEKNELQHLPEWVGNLGHLKELYLQVNRLTSLPDSLTCLSELTNLSVAYNRLSSLPQSLGDLSLLKHLDLSQNLLTHLPDSFANFNPGIQINLTVNPLSFISYRNLQTNPALHSLLTYRQECIDYPCHTQVAQFFQALICEDFVTAKEVFPSFPDCLKVELIRKYGQYAELKIPSASQFSIPQDFDTFVDPYWLSVVFRDYFLTSRFPKEVQRSILAQISQLAGKGRDEQWGREHVVDHLLRFIDACALTLYPKTAVSTPIFSRKRKREEGEFVQSLLPG